MPRLFALGQCFVTPGLLETLDRNGLAYFGFLGRHGAGDWGSVSAEVAETNNAILRGDETGQILSIYALPDGSDLWVITEGDRSETRMFLADEAEWEQPCQN